MGGATVSRLSQVAVAAWSHRAAPAIHLQALGRIQQALHLPAPHRLVSEPQSTGEYSFRVGDTDLQFLYGTGEGSAISRALVDPKGGQEKSPHFHHIAVEVAFTGDADAAREAIYTQAAQLRAAGVNVIDQEQRAVDAGRDKAVVQGADGGLAFFVHPKTTQDRGSLGALIEFNVPGDQHGELVEGLPKVDGEPLVDRVAAVSFASSNPAEASQLLELLFGVKPRKPFTIPNASGHPIQVVEHPVDAQAAFRVLSTKVADTGLAKFLGQPGSRIYSATFWSSRWHPAAMNLADARWLKPLDSPGGALRLRGYAPTEGSSRLVASLNPDRVMGLRFDIEGA